MFRQYDVDFHLVTLRDRHSHVLARKATRSAAVVSIPQFESKAVRLLFPHKRGTQNARFVGGHPKGATWREHRQTRPGIESRAPREFTQASATGLIARRDHRGDALAHHQLWKPFGCALTLT
jgi:hypothetical protein